MADYKFHTKEFADRQAYEAGKLAADQAYEAELAAERAMLRKSNDSNSDDDKIIDVVGDDESSDQTEKDDEPGTSSGAQSKPKKKRSRRAKKLFTKKLFTKKLFSPPPKPKPKSNDDNKESDTSPPMSILGKRVKAAAENRRKASESDLEPSSKNAKRVEKSPLMLRVEGLLLKMGRQRKMDRDSDEQRNNEANGSEQPQGKNHHPSAEQDQDDKQEEVAVQKKTPMEPFSNYYSLQDGEVLKRVISARRTAPNGEIFCAIELEIPGQQGQPQLKTKFWPSIEVYKVNRDLLLDYYEETMAENVIGIGANPIDVDEDEIDGEQDEDVPKSTVVTRNVNIH